MVVVLMIAGVVFMVGLACSVGYTGTTAVKTLNSTDDMADWNSFLGLFTNPDTGLSSTKGKNPYLFSTQAQLEAKQDSRSQTIDFDRRLIRTLSYIALQKDSPKKCGWSPIDGVDPKHERVKVEVQTAKSDSLSDLSPQPSSAASTLGRGTGARFSESGYMRCSWKYRSGLDCPLGDNKWHVYGQYKILLNELQPLIIDKIPPTTPPYAPFPPYVAFMSHCSAKIACAVDYFPSPDPPAPITPEGADLILLRPKGLVLPMGLTSLYQFDSAYIGALNPNVFDDIPPITPPTALPPIILDKAKLASAYKAAQLALELLTIDNADCEHPSQNIENNRNIPITIIFPQWIAGIMEDRGVWAKFMEIAKSPAGFPYNLQTESPLAGLSFDSALDNIGLHFNY